jgi:hypothetical protein
MRGSIAIMQPYAFPYIGYFALVEASARFVFYDDVQHKPRGWINRNRILMQGQDHLFSIPVSKSSQNAMIQDVLLHEPEAFRALFLQQLGQSYRRAPHARVAMRYVDEVLSAGHRSIAELAMHSVQCACTLIGIEREFLRSSVSFADTRGLPRADRLIAIAHASGASRYVNSPGGHSLYEPAYFAKQGIALQFVETALVPYNQVGTNSFVPGLSIIDVLMHNDARSISSMLRLQHLTEAECT